MQIVDFYRRIHFTESVEPIIVNSNHESSFLELVIRINFENENGVLISDVLENRYSFFKGSAKIFLGREIENFIEGKNPVFSYNSIKVDLLFREWNRNDETLIDYQIIEGINFVYGNSFDFRPYKRILNRVKNQKRRIFKHENCKFHINVLDADGFENSKLEVYLNNIFKGNIEVENNESDVINTFTLPVINEMFEVNEGDVVRFSYNDTNQEYVIFPFNRDITSIYYLNEWKVLNCFYFLGDYGIEDNLNFTSFENYKNFEYFLNNISFKESFEFSINTGFITALEFDHLKDLLKSKTCYVGTIPKVNNSLIYREFTLAPISQKLKGVDSAKSLHSYDVKFLVNLEPIENNLIEGRFEILSDELLYACNRKLNIKFNTINFDGDINVKFKINVSGSGSVGFDGDGFIAGESVFIEKQITTDQEFELILYSQTDQGFVIFECLVIDENGNRISETLTLQHQCLSVQSSYVRLKNVPCGSVSSGATVAAYYAGESNNQLEVGSILYTNELLNNYFNGQNENGAMWRIVNEDNSINEEYFIINESGEVIEQGNCTIPETPLKLSEAVCGNPITDYEDKIWLDTNFTGGVDVGDKVLNLDGSVFNGNNLKYHLRVEGVFILDVAILANKLYQIDNNGNIVSTEDCLNLGFMGVYFNKSENHNNCVSSVVIEVEPFLAGSYRIIIESDFSDGADWASEIQIPSSSGQIINSYYEVVITTSKTFSFGISAKSIDDNENLPESTIKLSAYKLDGTLIRDYTLSRKHLNFQCG